MITNYSPPLYQLSYREAVEKRMFRWLVCSPGLCKMSKQTRYWNLSFLKKNSQKRLKTLYIYSKHFFAADPVAQWIARRTSNPEAVGSSPTGVVSLLHRTCKFDMFSCHGHLTVTLQLPDIAYNRLTGKTSGLDRDLNPGPRAPEARIIPLDHRAYAHSWPIKPCRSKSGARHTSPNSKSD